MSGSGSGDAGLKKQLKAAQEELAAARKYMETYAANLHAEVKPRLDAAKILHTEYAQVQEDLRQKEQLLALFRTAVADCKVEIKSLKDKLEEKEEALKASDRKTQKSGGASVSASEVVSASADSAFAEELSALNAQLLLANEENGALKEKIKAFTIEIQTIKASKTSENKASEVQKTRLVQELQAVTDTLAATRSDSSRDLAALRERLDQANKEIAVLEDRLRASDAEKAALERDVADKDSKLLALTRELERVCLENQALHVRAAAGADSIAALEVQVTRLQAAAAAPAVPAAAELEGRMAQLQGEHSALQGQLALIKEQLLALRKSSSLREAENLGARRVLDGQNVELREKLTAARMQIGGLSSRLAHASSAAQFYCQQFFGISKELGFLKTQLASQASTLNWTEHQRKMLKEDLQRIFDRIQKIELRRQSDLESAPAAVMASAVTGLEATAAGGSEAVAGAGSALVLAPGATRGMDLSSIPKPATVVRESSTDSTGATDSTADAPSPPH